MMWHYYCPLPYANRQSSNYQNVIRELISEGLLDYEDSQGGKYSGVGATLKGRAWVEMICATPYPERKEIWVDPRTDSEISG